VVFAPRQVRFRLIRSDAVTGPVNKRKRKRVASDDEARQPRSKRARSAADLSDAERLARRTQRGPAALTSTDAMDLQAAYGNQNFVQQVVGTPTAAAAEQPGPAGRIADPQPKRATYVHGQHGAKTREQERLTTALGQQVTGDTHESEHTIGYEPLAQTGGLKRDGSSRARWLENVAPAYQEVKAMHRAHIGTGSQQTPDESGFTASTYRSTQRSLTEAGDISSAVQLNQLGYAFTDGFQPGEGAQGTVAAQQADDSYDTMIDNLGSVMYADGAQQRVVDVDALSRAEMFLARRIATTGLWPTSEEIAAAKRRFGVEEQ
jgi:hypothetical protein